jgi:maleate isomerase
VAALRKHGIEHVQLVHPPWFDPEFDELGAAYFRSQGFSPVVTKAVDLADDPARVDARGVIDCVEHHVEDRTEAVFLAGNGFCAAGAVQELERRTGRLVLEANQALLWGILAATGTEWDVTDHGRLLRASIQTCPPEGASSRRLSAPAIHPDLPMSARWSSEA